MESTKEYNRRIAEAARTPKRPRQEMKAQNEVLRARIAELEAERNTGCCDHSCWLKLAGFASSKGMGTNGGKCLCPDWKKQYAFNRLQARLALAEKVCEAADELEHMAGCANCTNYRAPCDCQLKPVLAALA